MEHPKIDNDAMLAFITAGAEFAKAIRAAGPSLEAISSPEEYEAWMTLANSLMPATAFEFPHNIDIGNPGDELAAERVVADRVAAGETM